MTRFSSLTWYNLEKSLPHVRASALVDAETDVHTGVVIRDGVDSKRIEIRSRVCLNNRCLVLHQNVVPAVNCCRARLLLLHLLQPLQEKPFPKSLDKFAKTVNGIGLLRVTFTRIVGLLWLFTRHCSEAGRHSLRMCLMGTAARLQLLSDDLQIQQQTAITFRWQLSGCSAGRQEAAVHLTLPPVCLLPQL